MKEFYASVGEEEVLDHEQRAHLRLAAHVLSRALRDLFSQDLDVRRAARKWLLGTYDYFPQDIGLKASFLCEALDINYIQLKTYILKNPKHVKNILRGFQDRYLRKNK